MGCSLTSLLNFVYRRFSGELCTSHQRRNNKMLRIWMKENAHVRTVPRAQSYPRDVVRAPSPPRASGG